VIENASMPDRVSLTFNSRSIVNATYNAEKMPLIIIKLENLIGIALAEMEKNDSFGDARYMVWMM